MSARFAVLPLAALLTGCAVSVPLQKTPPQVERPPAPIAVAGPAYAAACRGEDGWDTPAPPVRIHANTYLVGTCGIAAILVTGKAGHVLIDASTEAGAEVVARNIRSLGFRLEDVIILLHSHEHVDHVGGIARLQQLTGARLLASAPAARVFATGTAAPGDPQAGSLPPFPAARVDGIVRDGEEVRLGNLMLTATATPGHTAGALSWRWGACDGGVCRTIVFADSLSPVSGERYRFSDHPAYLAAYRASIARVAALPCDILLTPHPSASDMLPRIAGEKPLFDPGGCRTYASALTRRLDERLAREAGR